jgi:AraC-like DNA-binding protein
MEPLADIMSLLRPRAVGTKLMQGAGRWGVHRAQTAYAGFGLVLMGGCWITVDGHAPLHLDTGDFILVPGAPGITIASDLDCDIVSLDAQDPMACQTSQGWYGDQDRQADFKQLGGSFELDAVNRGLLAAMLPTFVHIQAADPAAKRLKRTIDLIVEESLADRPGRNLVIDRFIEVLLVEALRFHSEGVDALGQPGLLAGLADPQLARALRFLHNEVANSWTVETLAKQAGLSRSVFSERFTHKVGVPPMQYLINWRIALAKAMLQRDAPPLETVAAAIGYQSASAFSTAFRREVGLAPREYARAMG